MSLNVNEDVDLCANVPDERYLYLDSFTAEHGFGKGSILGGSFHGLNFVSHEKDASFLGDTLLNQPEGSGSREALLPPCDAYSRSPRLMISYDENIPVLVTSSDNAHKTAPKARPSTGRTGTTLKEARKQVIAAKKQPQTEEERIQERNKKGRERSMRTRRRNAARLKNLQDNCAYLNRENGVLRELLCGIRSQADAAVIASLLGALAVCRDSRPPPHQLSDPAPQIMPTEHRMQGAFVNTTPIKPQLMPPYDPVAYRSLQLKEEVHAEMEPKPTLEGDLGRQRRRPEQVGGDAGYTPNDGAVPAVSVTATQTIATEGTDRVQTAGAGSDDLGDTTSTNERVGQSEAEASSFLGPVVAFDEHEVVASLSGGVDQPPLTVEEVVRIILGGRAGRA